MEEIVEAARKNNGIPRTAQQSIPFDRMFPDGICRVGENYYTKTIQFQDINYQLAQQEDKRCKGITPDIRKGDDGCIFPD